MRISDWSSDVCSSDLLYRLTWFASPLDVNREVNNGRGPVDYKVSMGNADKTLVEFKLARNTKLKANLKSQVQIYEVANDTKSSITVILYFTDGEWGRVQKILRDLEINNAKNIVRSEEHTSELQSLMRISYAVFYLKK